MHLPFWFWKLCKKITCASIQLQTTQNILPFTPAVLPTTKVFGLKNFGRESTVQNDHFLTYLQTTMKSHGFETSKNGWFLNSSFILRPDGFSLKPDPQWNFTICTVFWWFKHFKRLLTPCKYDLKILRSFWTFSMNLNSVNHKIYHHIYSLTYIRTEVYNSTLWGKRRIWYLKETCISHKIKYFLLIWLT